MAKTHMCILLVLTVVLSGALAQSPVPRRLLIAPGPLDAPTPRRLNEEAGSPIARRLTELNLLSGSPMPRRLTELELGSPMPRRLTEMEGGSPMPRRLTEMEGGSPIPRRLTEMEGGSPMPRRLTEMEGGSPMPRRLTEVDGSGSPMPRRLTEDNGSGSPMPRRLTEDVEDGSTVSGQLVETPAVSVPTARRLSETELETLAELCMTPLEVINMRDDLSIFASVIEVAELVDSLSDVRNELVVYVPTNAAFDAYFVSNGIGADDFLSNSDLVTALLKAHLTSLEQNGEAFMQVSGSPLLRCGSYVYTVDNVSLEPASVAAAQA